MNTNNLNRIGFLLVIVLGLTLALSACTAVQADRSAKPTRVTSHLGTPTARPSVPEQLVLEWEGFGLWGDEDATKCKTMQIDAENQMSMGYCGNAPTARSLNRSEFGEMLEHFGPFEYQSAPDHLIFRGRGQTGSPAWQRAMLSWVHWTYAEALTGRACAACRTALS